MTNDRRHYAPRRPGHDYTRAGMYFVTVRTQHGLPLFGTVEGSSMQRSPAGEMVAGWWAQLPRKYAALATDAFVVMPNHIHGILVLEQSGAVALPAVMQWFKAMTTNAYIRGVRDQGWARFPGKLWQRSYHDRVIRSGVERDRIRQYIRANPANWHRDAFRNDTH